MDLTGRTAMRCSTLLCILTGVLVYLIVGALVFQYLEAPYEKGIHSNLLETQQEFLGNYTCVSPDMLQALIEVLGKKHIIYIKLKMLISLIS